MDGTFWWGIIGGIAVTIAIGLPLNFIANIYTPSLMEAWNRRRSARQERGKANALVAYKFVDDLRTGRKDKYAYLLTEYVSFLFLLIIALLLIVVGVLSLTLLLVHKSGESSIPLTLLLGTPEPVVITLVAVCVSLIALLGAFYVSRRTQTLVWRLSNFDEYKAQVEQKWGAIR